MGWSVGLMLLFPVWACSDGNDRVAVVPLSIVVSPDRRAITVGTSYPLSVFCAKVGGGLTVDVGGDVAVVTAIMKREGEAERCTLECGYVTQSTTLAEPLPDGVRFEHPADADPGCGGQPSGVTTTMVTDLP
jgi:hypothetical protein